MEISRQEGNKLIAEFVSSQEAYSYDGTFIPLDNNSEMVFVKYEDMRYNSSWDWLMPVVVKINVALHEEEEKVTRDEWDDGEDKDLDDASGWRAWSYRQVNVRTGIEEVYEDVIEAIKWYNSKTDGNKKQ